MEKIKLLYEGKAKQIYSTEEEDKIIMHYKDDATAFNGVKHAQIAKKGELNNKISTLIFKKLQEKGVPTHLIETLNDRDQLCYKVDIVPLEVIIRNYIAGSMAKRLGIEEGTKAKTTVFEICYKCDELNDPLINNDHAVAIGIATYEELNKIREMALAINNYLTEIFDKSGVILIDFKIEFGRTKDGKIVLADEISPDSCRLWDKKTHEHLDKDLFRRDLGDIIPAYMKILELLQK